MKKFLTAVILLFIAALTTAWINGNAADNVIKTTRFDAGGQLTRVYAECDQGVGQCNNSGTSTLVTGADTYGAYVWKTVGVCSINVPAPCWNQIVTFSTLPVNDPIAAYGACTAGNPCAAYEIRTAPSNSNVAYMNLKGYVYRHDHFVDCFKNDVIPLSDSRCRWIATTFTPQTVYPNENSKFIGPHIAIDPQNPDVAIAGTPSGNAFYTINKGANWTAITLGSSCTPANVPNAHGGGYNVAYDYSSSVSGGLKQGIFLSCYGTGVYNSTTGPSGTFSLLNTSGMPTSVQHMVTSPAGLLYAADGLDVKLYTSGAWSTVFNGTTLEVAARAIAIDMNNPTHLLVLGGASTGGVYYSTNNATAPTWGNKITAFTRSSVAIPWLALSSAELGSTSFADVVFDPAQSNVAIIADGIANWSVSPNLLGNCGNYCYALTAMAAGIQQLVANWMVSPPGGNPVAFAWDRPVWTITNPRVPQSNYGVNHAQSITMGWGGDYAPGNYVFAYVNFGTASVQNSAYSSNGGGSGAPSDWTVFSSQPSPVQFSGNLSAIDSNHIAIAQNSIYGSIFASTDRGASWPLVTSCSGVPAPGQNNVTQSQTITGSGTITFTNVGTGYTYPADATVSVYRTSDSASAMFGTVTSYNSGTGQLVLAITSNSGAGTFSDWSIYQYTGWGSNVGFLVNRQIMTADKTGNVYYAFNYNFAPGVYRISADGATCTRVKTTNFDSLTFDAYGAKMINPPGKSGELFFTAGSQDPDQPTQKFWHCTGGAGASLTCSDTDQYVSGVTDVIAFGFGATKSGDTYPPLYCYCRVSGDMGLWRGTGLSTTPVWDKLSHYAIGDWIDTVSSVTGDMNTYGKVYIGFFGSGWKDGQFNFLLKRDLDPASNDNTPMWLEKAA